VVEKNGIAGITLRGEASDDCWLGSWAGVPPHGQLQPNEEA